MTAEASKIATNTRRMKSFSKELKKINACKEAVDWVGRKGFKKSWATCERGDWMLWYVFRNRDKLGLDDMRLISIAKAKTANLVRHLIKDERSTKAIDAALAFGNGEISRQELRDAAYAAADAAYAAAAADAAYAAAAADADDAADAAAYAAADAAYAADDAAYAAAYAAADAKKDILKKSADICREVFKDVIL